MLEEFEGRRFGTILLDPPWRYGDKLPGPKRGAVKHYDVMTPGEIAALPIDELAAPDAHVYLWTTNSHVEDAYKILRIWGFEPKTQLAWVKLTQRGEPVYGMGRYYRGAFEPVIFAVRGKARPPKAIHRNVILAPRREHSRKPDELYTMIEDTSPGPYLELFARHRREGWESWGDELCRCTVEPCDPNCTCANPYMSGGCVCGKFGA